MAKTIEQRSDRAQSAGGPAGRRWWRPAFLATTAVLALAIAAGSIYTGSLYLYADSKFRHVTQSPRYVGGPCVHKACDYLILGNDSRKGLTRGQQSYFGNATIDTATNDLLATLQQSSPYLRVASGSGQRVRMANGTALAATMRGTDPATGIAERVTVVTRQLADEHLIYMLFITPERDASRYSSVLNAMVNSMQINETRAH